MKTLKKHLYNPEELKARAFSLFAPPPEMLVSEWANNFRKLSPESSAESGDFDISRTPFMRGIIDCYNDPTIEEIVLMKSAQVGYSENLNNIVGYIIDQNPASILMMQPTVELAESYSKDRIAPMLRDTPCLAKLFSTKGSRKSSETILQKRFAGGYLVLIGANSPASMASRPIRDVLGDEPDRWGACKEGEQWGLLKARQITFFNKKRFIGGTPTVKGASRIEKFYKTGDQRKYLVPCPRCGEHISLDRENFVTNKESEFYAKYCCQICGGYIEEHERFDMMRDEKSGGTAHWKATAQPSSSGIASFLIWAAYSPFIGWREIFDKYHDAKADPEDEQVIFNTLFGESYEHKYTELDHDHLYKLREPYDAQNLPEKCLFLTAGIDTQDDRFEIEIVAWGRNEESWSVEYLQIDGDPEEPKTRQELDDYLLNFTAQTVDGRTLTIRAALVDSGGHKTDAVYSFCKGKNGRGIFPSKGSSVSGQPVIARVSYQKRSRVKLILIGTDTAKATIYSRLAKGAESHARLHFPLHYSLNYFQGLTSEEKKIIWKRGNPSVIFAKRKGENKSRNEPLDCRVYAYAAMKNSAMLRSIASFSKSEYIEEQKRKIAESLPDEGELEFTITKTAKTDAPPPNQIEEPPENCKSEETEQERKARQLAEWRQKQAAITRFRRNARGNF